jgi:aspartyl-tRNA(Asn)/glutamyl-tRNA(Gln) amidotransferase subunit C
MGPRGPAGDRMDRETVARVARTAHIRLTDEELDRYSKDLADILDYFRVLDEAPGHDGVGVNPVEIADVTREDEPHQDIDPAVLLKDMKTYENYVRGPKLV